MNIKQLNKEIKKLYPDIKEIKRDKYFYQIWINTPLSRENYLSDSNLKNELMFFTRKNLKFLCTTIFKDEVCLSYEVV